MVDKVSIDPKTFSKRGGGAVGVPQLESIPSLRNIGTVQDVGTQAQAQAFLSLADDGLRLQQLSGESFDRHLEEVRADQSLEAERIYANSLVGITESIENLRQTEDNIEELPFQTLKLYDEASRNVINQTQGLSNYQRKVLGERYDQQRMQVVNNTLNYQANLRDIERSNNVAEILQSTSLYLYNNPGALDARMGELETALRDAGLSVLEAEQEVLKSRTQLAGSAIKGAIAKSPGATLNAINAGQYDAYIDGDTKAQLAKYADSQIKKAAPARTVEELKALGEFRARVKDDPTQFTDVDIVSMAETLNLKSSEVASIFEDRATAMIEQEGQIIKDQRVMDVLANPDAFLNPRIKEDKELADEFAQRHLVPNVMESMASGDVDGASMMIADYANKTGIFPETLQNEILGRIRMGSPDQKIMAMDIVNRVKELNPNVDIDIKPEEKAIADVYNSIMRFEPDEEKVKQQAEDILRMDPAKIQQRKSEVQSIWSEDNAKLKGDLFDGLKDRFDPVGLFNRPNYTIPKDREFRLLQDMRKAYESYYVRNPDPIKARDYAIEAVASLSGITKVDGSEQILQYAPEKLMPSINGSHDYIGLDFDESITPLLAEGQEAFLGEDSITSRTADKQAILRSGLAPSYPVLVIDKDGVVSNLRKNGKIIRYTPPMPTGAVIDEDYKRKLDEWRQSLPNKKVKSDALQNLFMLAF